MQVCLHGDTQTVRDQGPRVRLCVRRHSSNAQAPLGSGKLEGLVTADCIGDIIRRAHRGSCGRRNARTLPVANEGRFARDARKPLLAPGHDGNTTSGIKQCRSASRGSESTSGDSYDHRQKHVRERAQSTIASRNFVIVIRYSLFTNHPARETMNWSIFPSGRTIIEIDSRTPPARTRYPRRTIPPRNPSPPAVNSVGAPSGPRLFA